MRAVIVSWTAGATILALLAVVDKATIWHTMAEAYANTKNIHIEDDVNDFLYPGTPGFEAAFKDITSRYNNEENGTRFYDKSALYHVHGEYTCLLYTSPSPRDS